MATSGLAHRQCHAHRLPQQACFKDSRQTSHSLRNSMLRCSRPSEYDVSAATINPVYRSVPQRAAQQDRQQVEVLFVGESNVCRSILAEAFMRDALKSCGLDKLVNCQSKGTRDHQLGDAPEKSTLEIVRRLQLQLPSDAIARIFNPEQDIVDFDLILTMDKYTAADVMREVTGYDLIDKDADFCSKVRLLGQFHPELSGRVEPDAQDIDDPLYGNVGGWQEQEAVTEAAHTIEAATLGLAQYLQGLHQAAERDGEPFVQRVRATVRSLERIDWLVPPMLQGRTSPPVPFI